MVRRGCCGRCELGAVEEFVADEFVTGDTLDAEAEAGAELSAA